MGNPTQKPETICWNCANACGKCSWSDGTFTPVEGWQAEHTKVRNAKFCYIESYRVISCPQFKSDKKKYASHDLPYHGTVLSDEDFIDSKLREISKLPTIETPERRQTRSNARKILESLPERELRNRIETLNGVDKKIALMSFCADQPNFKIAQALNYSERTVERRLTEIYKKLVG